VPAAIGPLGAPTGWQRKSAVATRRIGRHRAVISYREIYFFSLKRHNLLMEKDNFFAALR
jgi:hypothetical protein